MAKIWIAKPSHSGSAAVKVPRTVRMQCCSVYSTTNSDRRSTDRIANRLSLSNR